MSRARTLAAAEKQLAAMLAAPVVDLVRASLMAQLIMSVKELPMDDQIIEANRALYALENAADDLRDVARNLHGLCALIDDFDRFDRAHDQIVAVFQKIKEARERQETKARDPQFQHLIAAE
jgi:hypothetical protein